MIRLTRITTKTGDTGTTALVGGARVPKHHHRIEALGAVDEANAAIGLARTCVADPESGWLAHVQQDLFDLGADLATPKADPGALRLVPEQVGWLEHTQTRLNAALAPLTSFVLPGGTPAAAHLHLARTLVRRAERRMTVLDAAEGINPEALRYINRLSDFLFVLARWCNDHGRTDVLWRPGLNRAEETPSIS